MPHCSSLTTRLLSLIASLSSIAIHGGVWSTYRAHGAPYFPFFFCFTHFAPVIKAELDQKIQDVFKHIQTERKILEASRLLSQATSNPDVLRRNDAKIRDTEQRLKYFEDTLRELQARKMQQQSGQDSSGSTGGPQVCLASLRFSLWGSGCISINLCAVGPTQG